MKSKLRIASKYLIEKSYFFSTSHLVLTLQEDHLQMQPLSKDREESEGGVTKIDWDSIVQVQASERNPREFTLFVVQGGKKPLPQKSTQNATQIVFQCNERNRLLTELIHKIVSFFLSYLLAHEEQL